MKDKKNFTILGVCVLVLVLVAGISIAYASFSQTLNINGSATVVSSSWEIKFANLQAGVTTGTADEITPPSINENDTAIKDYVVIFMTPGDSVSYTFDVQNNGSFNSEISTLNVGTPSCTGTGDNATTDADNVCNNLTYTLTYSDGTAVAVGDTLTTDEKTKTMKLTLTYASDVEASELPTNDVAISGLATTIIYTQTA